MFAEGRGNGECRLADGGEHDLSRQRAQAAYPDPEAPDAVTGLVSART
jgi:hypothetical protein